MYVWKKLEEKDFINYFNKMCNDFPYEERRDCEKQKRLLSNENYNWYIVKDETGECAYLTYWEYDDFVFVEHFAIEKNKRGKGHGSLVLQEFINFIDIYECFLRPPSNLLHRQSHTILNHPL